MQWADLVGKEVRVQVGKKTRVGVLQGEMKDEIGLRINGKVETIKKDQIGKLASTAKEKAPAVMPTDAQIGPAHQPAAPDNAIFQEYEMDATDAERFNLDKIEKQIPQNHCQFATNAKLTGKPSDYDFNLYTVGIGQKPKADAKPAALSREEFNKQLCEKPQSHAIVTETNLVTKFSLSGNDEEQKMAVRVNVDFDKLKQEQTKKTPSVHLSDKPENQAAAPSVFTMKVAEKPEKPKYKFQ